MVRILCVAWILCILRFVSEGSEKQQALDEASVYKRVSCDSL